MSEAKGSFSAKRRSSNRQIAIVPFETYDLSAFRESLETAALIFGLELSFSNDAFVSIGSSKAEEHRRQRDAVKIIEAARKILKENGENSKYALIVTKQDIFASRFNFVFGLANRDLGVGLISTARLAEWYDGLSASQMRERVLKEAAHEIGHLRGLAHCGNETCLMAFSETLEEVDRKLPILCQNCRKRLRTDGR